MKDKIFLDTNIFVYAVDTSAQNTEKSLMARDLIGKIIEDGNGVISLQVMQEFLQSTTKKIDVPLSIDDALEYLKYISIMEVVTPNFDMIVLAARVHQKHNFSFWDSMIIQAALSVGCKEVLTEDMQDGFIIDGMKIINPFKEIRDISLFPQGG